ncbi:hypothetical protein IC762_25670 [Bradyrhizobium genosp. L]|uniref:hypothetical protein n=1 Tax=Bradyrhizobium genosp. L TaxID=83637 RepID=UPI0018A2F84A|nr:hypothetical protein [Bradyrhizobium genosp. L]QPF83103.1 hypothetical protein IC762_25670 [Bradyrhizobium genosp. L]
MIFYLTTDTLDLLLKLVLPPSITFLAGWWLIGRWASRPGIAAAGFSPAFASAFFTPAIFVTYLCFPLRLFMPHGTVAILYEISYAVILCTVVFAPTFFLLLPIGIKSLVRQRCAQPLSNRLLYGMFATWLTLQAGVLLFIFKYLLGGF